MSSNSVLYRLPAFTVNPKTPRIGPVYLGTRPKCRSEECINACGAPRVKNCQENRLANEYVYAPYASYYSNPSIREGSVVYYKPV